MKNEAGIDIQLTRTMDGLEENDMKNVFQEWNSLSNENKTGEDLVNLLLKFSKPVEIPLEALIKNHKKDSK